MTDEAGITRSVLSEQVKGRLLKDRVFLLKVQELLKNREFLLKV